MSSAGKAGVKGYVKTNIFLTAYEEGIVQNLLKNLSERGYKILEFSKSDVVDYVYFISVEGDAREAEELLKDKAPWFKVELLEFK